MLLFNKEKCVTVGVVMFLVRRCLFNVCGRSLGCRGFLTGTVLCKVVRTEEFMLPGLFERERERERTDAGEG